MLDRSSGTLGYYKAKPLFRSLDARWVSASTVALHLIKWEDSIRLTGKLQTSVEEEALLFYLGNHGMAALSQKFDDWETLPPEANLMAEMYSRVASQQFLRLFFYTLMAITRESRHLKNASSIKSDLTSIAGSDFVLFRNALNDASHAQEKFRKTNLSCSIWQYSSAMEYLFDAGDFVSGYGGKAWGNIARALRRFTTGELTAEGFMDTAWTLAHNNGPMFNKGMYYRGWKPGLYKILDVQRAGMIPQLISECVKGSQHKVHVKGCEGLTVAVAAAHTGWQEVHPEFNGFVDWFAVEKLGEKTYYDEQQLQLKNSHAPKVPVVPVAPQKPQLQISQYEAVDIIQRQAYA